MTLSAPRALAGLLLLLVLLPVGGLVAALVQGGGGDPLSWLAAPGTGALLGRSVALAVVVTGLVLPAGAFLAWAEQRARRPRWLPPAWVALLPLAMPSYLVASALREALGPGGWPGRWLGGGVFAGFWPSALVLAVITLPFVQLLVGAALARSSASEEEAARLLGAGPWRRFRTVLLPGLRPALGVSALLSLVYVLGDFGAVAVLDCQVLTWRLYQSVQHQQLDVATLQGFSLLLLTVPAVLLAQRGQSAFARPGVANPRPAVRAALPGPAVALLALLLLLVVGLGVLLPVGTLVGWLVDAARRGEGLAPLWGPARDSLRVAGLGALLTVGLAAAPAWIAARGRGRGPRAMELVVFTASALPGVLVAFGLLLLALLASRALGDGGTLYQWLQRAGLLLLCGYALRFVAEAFAALRSTMGQVDARWLEAARLLDPSPLRLWRQVLGPALAPGAAAAFVLVFVAILKELPVTLMLGSALGLRTLSFRAFDRYREAFLADAAASGLLLLLFSFLALALSLRWRRHV